ncbi:MAG: acyl-CoA desaturase [Hymenobacteraceae bacterium]|nr:acyl-CoA desaturase [Hymenobacteraceae bacterium]
MAAPRFLSPKTSFYADLKERTNQYFKDLNISPAGNAKLYFKAVTLIVALVSVYVHLVFFTPAVWLAVLECVVLGGLTASIGFNIMHDGAHGSFSKFKKLNDWAGLSINFLGANVFLWNTKHNVIHHTYTNIDGVDDDLDAGFFLRLSKTQKYYKIHRFQHFYFWTAYSMLFFYWVFFADYQKYFTQKVGFMPIKKMKRKEHVSFWGFKFIHASLFILIPILSVGFLPWLVGFLIYGTFTGFVMSIVFQLAHTVEETHFPMPEQKTNKIDDEWALHQLKTTANFATNNKLISWLTGGLNFQIEHHLFPKISHIHYPAISKIIKETCAEYGITYNEFPGLRMAVASHVSHLKQLSRR